MRRKGGFFSIILLGFSGGLEAQTSVTLSPTVSPGSGEPGVTLVMITGSGFPTGTIAPANVTVTLTPSAGGVAVTTVASAVTTVVGSTRRVSFTIPSSFSVAAPTLYSVSLAGTASTGTPFASSNTVSLTINPNATLVSVIPGSGQTGQTLSVTITGQWSNFVQGSTQASWGAGISVGGAAAGAFGPVTVINATTATATVSLASNAASGIRAVTLQTGAEQATLNSGFTVQVATPTITSVIPASGQQGQVITGVTITGTATHFTQGAPAVTFSNPGVTASAVQVKDDTHLTVTLTTLANAATGASNVTVVTGSETATGTGLFTVGASTPVISQINPNTGQQSQQNLVVTINGQSTHFVQGTTTVNFGALITVKSLIVNSPTSLTAVLAIDPASATGARTVMVTTNTEVVTGGFTVTPGTPAITSVTPNSGQQGQTVTNVTLLGVFSHFTQGTPVVWFSVPGITASAVQAIDNTHLRMSLTIAAAESTGASNVTVVTGSETATGTGLFTVVAGPPPTLTGPTITFTSPANLSFLNISPTTVNGRVSDPAATVTINSITAPLANGTFSIQLPLAEGPNLITATAKSASGLVGTATIQVTLDTTPPHVTITSPVDQFVTTANSVSVAGNVNDIVVGTVNAQQAQVTVNGLAAQVANRTFLAMNVPLNLGSNAIQAVARDQAGNPATTQITVIRQTPAAQPQIQLVSGNNQSGVIGSVLPAPLVVALTNASGNPAPNTPVVFQVTQDNGMVAGSGAPSSSITVMTNAQGQAQAQWTLGKRAGAGSDSVQAYAVGFGGTAVFTASATQGPAGNIVIDSGNNQTGVVNQGLPKPLIAVVIDSGNNRLPNVPVTFTVLQGGGSFGGQTSITVNTDSDGRAGVTLTLGLQEGNSNNLISANFSNNQGFPASFTASGRAEGLAINTVISGVVLDNSNLPLPGVTIRAVLTNLLTSNSNIINAAATVQTNAQGQFTIPQASVGFVKLLVDGSTAQKAGTYPTLDYDMVTIAGQTNTLGMPIYLLPLNTSNQLCVTATTGGGTLTIPEAPGFSLTFGPGQVTFPGGSQTGCVSVTVVHADKVPMPPGFGQQPRFIVTIQPSGALFNPPAPITLPNVDGLAARAVTEMYSFDHDIGSFVAIGTGTVSDDGQVIRSNPGVGVLKAGWHCGGDPGHIGTAADCAVCQWCQGPDGGGLPGGSCVANPNINGTNCTLQNQSGVAICSNGTCQPITVEIDINGTSTTSDDITVLTPVQKIPATIVLHGGGGQPIPITLSISPSASLDTTSLTLSDSQSATVTITPLQVSAAVNDVILSASVYGTVAGTGNLTIVKVTIPPIRAPNTPTGMPARIPPRTSTQVMIAVEPDLGSSGQAVVLTTAGTSSTFGDFSIDGLVTEVLTRSTLVSLSGTVQTAATFGSGGGNAGRLSLIAIVRGQNAVQSSGFSVAAIPTGLTEAFSQYVVQFETTPLFSLFGIGSQTRGIKISLSVTSDSGNPTDLDQILILEQIELAGTTGYFQDLASQVQTVPFPANVPLSDQHSISGTAEILSNGHDLVKQTHVFFDKRTGTSYIVIANSGYQVTQDLVEQNGQFVFNVQKVGAATTANGYTSAAGATANNAPITGSLPFAPIP